MRRCVIAIAAIISTVIAVPAIAVGAPATQSVVMAKSNARPLTVKGRLAPVGSITSVILIGNKGASASARVKKSGAFVIKVRKGRLASRLNPAKGAGPTLHLLRDGKYVGPVLLKSKGKRGYARLATGLPKTVNLRTVKVKSTGFGRVKKAPKKRLIDLKRSVPLLKGAPKGAGSQGATGKLRSAAASRLTVNDLSQKQSDLGADLDKDGVPNVADVDLNGDQVLDAAQADAPLQTADGRLGGDNVLQGRQWGLVDYKKILNMDRTRAVNSNRNPSVTWEELTAYLRDNLSIEAAAPPGTLQKLLCNGAENTCDAAKAVARLTMDCSWLSYCQPGSQAVILAPPGSPLDRAPLTDLLDADGQLVMPRDPASGPLMNAEVRLGFFPKTTSPDNVQMTGDAFEFTAYSGDGTVLAREAKVLTSSVATAMEWQSVAGTPVPVDADLAKPLPVPTARPVAIAFYRPQRLADSPRGANPELLDRGGLQYSVYIMDSAANTSYNCRPSQVTATSPDLVELVARGPYEGAPLLYDKNLNPTNGTALTFALNIPGCLANPESGPQSPPPVGAQLRVEIMAEDSDGNRAMSNFALTMK